MKHSFEGQWNIAYSFFKPKVRFLSLWYQPKCYKESKDYSIAIQDHDTENLRKLTKLKRVLKMVLFWVDSKVFRAYYDISILGWTFFSSF